MFYLLSGIIIIAIYYWLIKKYQYVIYTHGWILIGTLCLLIPFYFVTSLYTLEETGKKIFLEMGYNWAWGSLYGSMVGIGIYLVTVFGLLFYFNRKIGLENGMNMLISFISCLIPIVLFYPFVALPGRYSLLLAFLVY
jgi:hypothetical protein